MTPLQRWAAEKKCCCHHPERYACAEGRLRASLSDYDMDKLRWSGEEIEPCDCSCHYEFFEEEDE